VAGVVGGDRLVLDGDLSTVELATSAEKNLA